MLLRAQRSYKTDRRISSYDHQTKSVNELQHNDYFTVSVYSEHFLEWLYVNIYFSSRVTGQTVRKLNLFILSYVVINIT